MMNTARNLILASAVLLAAACNTTTFNSTWKAPGIAPISPVGKKIAAVFITPDESKRRAGEDALAGDLTRRGATGIPAYTLVADGHTNPDAARAALKAAGCNGAVIMRVVGKDQQINYTPGMATPVRYGGFGPYWGYGWGTVYDPGYLTTDTIVSVETLVYRLSDDKLLWASTSRTTNPGNLDQLVNDVADATGKEMVKQGLIEKQ
jgi:hypothetical protein